MLPIKSHFLRQLLYSIVFAPSLGSCLLKWAAHSWGLGMIIKTMMVDKISVRQRLRPVQGWMRNRVIDKCFEERYLIHEIIPTRRQGVMEMIIKIIAWQTWRWPLARHILKFHTGMRSTTWSYSAIHQQVSSSISCKPQDRREGCKDKVNDWHAITIVRTLFSQSCSGIIQEGLYSEGDVVKTMVNRGLVGWYIDKGIQCLWDCSIVIDIE